MSTCPHCAGKNVRSEKTLKRDDGTTGFFCHDCALAFIPHPDVKPIKRGEQKAFEVGEIVSRPRLHSHKRGKKRERVKFIPQPGKVAGLSVQKAAPVGPHFVIEK